MQWTRRGKVLAALAGVAAAGAAWAVLREKKPWTPPYGVDEADGAIEIRSYPTIAAAETVRGGTRDRALGDAFDRLAAHATRDGGTGMTVPLIAARAGPRSWRVRLPLPADAPPAAGGEVAAAAIPARRIAAIRFAGKADDRTLADKEAELRAWLVGRGIAAEGEAEHAFYNSPMLPGLVRRSEVWLALPETEK